jgi:Uma2 family endonuclease
VRNGQLCYDHRMNTHFRPDNLPMTTQAAEGLARRLWTVAEIEAMVQAGIIDEDERFELIEGEVVPMSPKGARHEHISASLLDYITDRKSKAWGIHLESTFRLDVSSFVEPDIIVYDRAIGFNNKNPKNVLLAIEIADSSLSYDRGRKADVYAKFGVREVWVINVKNMETTVFSEPGPGGYTSKKTIKSSEVLYFTFAPELSLKLKDLPLV